MVFNLSVLKLIEAQLKLSRLHCMSNYKQKSRDH